ncbi:hypothetical protein HRI_003665900 [Hibiscus trionum]|uniref:Uncharacterized protein n=1 Tax=Hibiscus trionum TaxID=183268 RepID=A0A9W7MGS7_HIBTR|nr:hypothetical protein HRI_003665900 [Hibiscus trionum]
MEDCNTLVADCLVICCCSQCLILQIIVFVFLELPRKLIRKTKRYAKKKLLIGHRRRGRRRTEEGKVMIELEMVKGGVFGDDVRVVANSCNCMSMNLDLAQAGAAQYGVRYCCMQEVEKVLEELSRKGEFAFGSFWGRTSHESDTTLSSTALVPSSSAASAFLLANYERFDFLRYELVDMSSLISAASCY